MPVMSFLRQQMKAFDLIATEQPQTKLFPVSHTPSVKIKIPRSGTRLEAYRNVIALQSPMDISQSVHAAVCQRTCTDRTSRQSYIL